MKSRKPSELLNLYSEKLNKGIEKKLSPLSFDLLFKYRSPHIAHISGFIIFRKGLILEFDEILKQEKTTAVRIKYRYHVMNQEKQLVIRYDNVPHHPKIKTHPHHKHIKNRVIESNAPGLLEVIDEIEMFIATSMDVIK
jgi:hypothetical protein